MLRTRARSTTSLLFAVWVVIGLVVAWQQGYLTPGLLKNVLSAVLAVLLWFLVLLGVDLHIG